MLSWSYKVGFLGTILLWEICLNRTGAGVNATPVLNRQGGNVLVAASYAVEFFFQNEYASYAGRSGRASVRSRRLAFSSSSCRLAISVCPLRGHLELSKTAPSVCLVKNENTSIKSFEQIDSSRIKQHLQKLRSDSFQKFSSCFATACI